ncbi:uncharacterized protein LOC127367993 isoform X2 [Dicentrarchus labrax]|uniref:uncharacterized protein LOC127367993 isoform X2 n=1 Tax=Dicentrarchus labrax TaxID=13489 RepID=UPI0021F529E0|nr:uncharacterized protein LOC127367993 isoform X2 [Dicentrarchus labrax]
MVEFRWIKMSLFLMLVLHFTAATGQLYLSFTVRAGDGVTLSCENVIKDQNNCGSTTWLFSGSRRIAAVELVTLGQIGKNTNSKSDRLSVTANCSLVIKKVTVEDVGRYTCRQFISGQQQGPDSVVDLSVITMTEHKDSDKVTLSCSVSTNGRCTHTVKWLNEGQDLDKDNQVVKTSQSPCNVSVTFKTSHYIYTSNSNSLKCAVTDAFKVQQFPFRLQPSGGKPGEDTKPTTTTENSIKAGTTLIPSLINDTSTVLKDLWWVFLIVAVVLVALVIIVWKVIRWKKTKGKKTKMNDNVGLTSNPAETQSAPETSQDTADPEDGVSYASISFTNKTNSKIQVQSKKDDDEGDAVTYTTVKTSSIDPSNLYATIK